MIGVPESLSDEGCIFDREGHSLHRVYLSKDCESYSMDDETRSMDCASESLTYEANSLSGEDYSLN
jgi:hypothetical protein